MIDYRVFKNGTKHIVTFSYDDGSKEDYRLVELFNKYKLHATFHLNSNRFADKQNSVFGGDIKSLYAGHEAAVHSVDHPWLEKMPQITVINQIIENRKAIEKECGYPVRGMSYPFGTFNNELISTLKSCGIVYSRTAGDSMGFGFPTDFMRWVPTCHHRNALSLCDSFLNSIQSPWFSGLFYIWGHSFEFSRDKEHGFDYMEQVCKKLSGHDDLVWYATNIEIYDYIKAQQALQVAADESFVHNPTEIDVWLLKDWKLYEIPATKTVVF